MEKILTVVIPSYNVEEYLEDCLESFVNSEVMDDTEILIVNDGSTDRTEDIAKRYEQKYPNTYRLISKVNGGHGSTINVGVKEAVGKYFKVVDGDDWVDTRNFIKFVKILKDQDADVVATNYMWMNHKTKIPERRQENPFSKITYGRVYRFDEVCNKVWIDMHAMTIKTEVLQKSGERIDEHTFYVDAEYITFPIPYVRSVIFLEETVYCYRLGMPGQSMSIQKMQKNMENHFRVLKRLNQFSLKMKGEISPEKQQYIDTVVANMLTSQIKIYVSYPLGSGMRKKVIRLDQYFYERNRNAYRLVKNPAVLLMRKTKYLTFPLVVVAFMYRRNSY